MKHLHLLYLYLAITLLFGACRNNSNNTFGESIKEAELLADSVSDLDSLLVYADNFAKQHKYSSEMILREKIGKVYRDLSNFEKALAQHDSAIALAKQTNDTLHLIRALNQQGTNFRRMGDMDEASHLHYHALELCDAMSDDTSFVARKNRVVSLNGLGNILLSMGNYEEAERVFRQALAGEQSLGSSVGQAINYANIGSIFEHRSMNDSARLYYNKSMEMNSNANNATGIGLCYQYLGKLDYKIGKLEDARLNYCKSYDVLLPTNDAWHWLEATIALSNLYLDASKADSARKYIEITNRTAKEINSLEHIATAYILASRYEEKWGSPSIALTYFKQGKSLNDSVLSEKNYNHLQNMRVQYEAKRRGAELEQAKNETRLEQINRQIILSVSIVGFIVLILVIFSLIKTNRIRKRSNRALQEANEVMTTANEELRKADEELRKADNERQTFYRDIAHRFRTPLTVVIGMTQQLREHINPNDEQAQGDFLSVERQNAELLRLVNEMMHKLQPNASTATVTSINGNLHVGNISDIHYNTNNNTENIKDNNTTLAKPNTDGSRPLILLAEDNEDVARYQCELLERNGYRVNWATDGVLALELLKEEMPMLVITDIMMPHMDGLDLCRNIRKNPETTHLPLIVVTARVEDRDRMKGLEAGAEVYLTKPFLGRELLLNIKNLIELREHLRIRYEDTKQETSNIPSTETVVSETDSTNENIEGNTRDSKPNNGIEVIAFQKMINEVIDANLSETDFNSTILAANLCLSRSQLNRRMNFELGIDTSSYIRKRRLEHACSMLRNTKMSIMDVQIACGFDSPGYFSRVFKQHFDKSPSEYRKNI